jgi:hypothetical protein
LFGSLLSLVALICSSNASSSRVLYNSSVESFVPGDKLRLPKYTSFCFLSVYKFAGIDSLSQLLDCAAAFNFGTFRFA